MILEDREDFYLPPPKEPWGPPIGNTREPRVSSTDQLAPLLIESPPSSPSDDSPEPRRRLSKSRRRDVASQSKRTDTPELKRQKTSSPSASSFSVKRSYDSNCRGKKLRTDKQEHWRNIENLLVHCGGLRGAKELHSGNKTSSKREFEELDILKEVDYLLTFLAKDEGNVAQMKSILRRLVWRRGSD